MSDPDIGVVGGRVENFPVHAGRLGWAELFDVVTAFPKEEYIHRSNFSVTANLVTRKSVFTTVGPFNDLLISGGDAE